MGKKVFPNISQNCSVVLLGVGWTFYYNVSQSRMTGLRSHDGAILL